jgi:hypothetical protein
MIMGSYGHILVGRYVAESFKSQVPPEILSLFDDTERLDLYGRTEYFDNRDTMCDRLFELTTLKDSEDGEYVCYAAPVGRLKDRLDILGFTARQTRECFEEGEEARLDPWYEAENPPQAPPRLGFHPKRETFEKWIASCKQLDPQATVVDLQRLEEPDVRYPPGLRSVVSWLYDTWQTTDIRWLIRALLELCDEDETVLLDITDLILGGYYEDDPLCEYAWYDIINEAPRDQRMVLLTEGSTDQRALQESFGLLYPHLKGFLSFFDFGAFNAQGGAAMLLALVRGFASAGIGNRIVALFDNDTAASDVLRGLDQGKLPKNIRVLQYPRLESATAYPTLGPSGAAEVDINGLAGSIELYFGRDVLEDGKGAMTPVQWRGYVRSLDRYQGELMNKAELQRRFFQKIERAKETPLFLESSDWSGIRSVFEMLRTAFD